MGRSGTVGSPTAFYLLLTIVSGGLALGGRYGLWQFVYWLPGFNFIRGSSRFMIWASSASPFWRVSDLTG